jgi:L-alanine-DL-glutamate epimerase-like enolase superfamily enzyme
MKITTVELYDIDTGGPAVMGAAGNPLCVRVNTDEGISGYGEAGFEKNSRAVFDALQNYAGCLIGEDPLNAEKIWQDIYRMAQPNEPAGIAGLSAYDLALWDIKGKVCGLPLYQLLGGKTNEKLRACASGLHYDWNSGKAEILFRKEQYAEVVQKVMEEGYTCVKVNPILFDENGTPFGWSTRGGLDAKLIRTVCERLEAMRKTGGDDLDIIVEIHSFTDAPAAIQLGRALSPYRIFYYEKPAAPLMPEMMKWIADSISIPVASGERIAGRRDFSPFLENRSLKVIQPDLSACGGIGEGKKICDLAQIYDAGVQLRTSGGPILQAAALQLEAAIPNFLVHEHHYRASLPESTRIGKYTYQPEQGYCAAPELPGLGQDLSEKIMKDFPPLVICEKTAAQQ